MASSQGSFSYLLYERMADNAFVTHFIIENGDTIDGAEETDGLDATAAPLGAAYSLGALIVQDGMNDPKGSVQNFKLVDWRQIQALINPKQ